MTNKVKWLFIIAWYILTCSTELSIGAFVQKKYLSKIKKLQNRAVKIIHNRKLNERGTSTLYKRSDILKLEDLLYLKTAIFMHDVHLNLSPTKVMKTFPKNRVIQNRAFRNADDFHVRRARLKTLSQSIIVRGPKLWNGMEQRLKLAASRSRLKRLIKRKLLESYWSYI